MSQFVKQHGKRLVASGVLLATLIVFSVSAIGSGGTSAAPSWRMGVPGEAFPEGVTTVAENDRYTLAIGKEIVQEEGSTAKSTLYSVQLTVLETGVTYSTAVSPEYYGKHLASKVLRDGLSKLFSITITDFDLRSEVLHSSAGGTEFHYETIDDGVRLYVYFSTREVGLTADFTIDDRGLAVSVPENGLVEDGKYGIVSLDVMPMFGAIRSGDDGYILFPDGSGAIYEIPEKATSQKFTTVDVYSPQELNLDTMAANQEQGIKNVMLPVFGVKNADSAVLGVITKGEAYAQLSLAPGGHMYDQLNRIYPTFRYRKSFEYQTTNDMEAYMVEKEHRLGDVGLRYFFLSGEEADYSGMAKVYREYLLEQGQLKASTMEAPVVTATFLGGVAADRLFGTTLETFSTFGDVEEIFRTLGEENRTRFLVTVAGWQKGGYNAYPAHLPVASSLGGKNKLQALAQTLGAYGASLLLNDNFLLVNENGSRPAAQIVYDYLNLPVSDGAEETYLLNPTMVQQALDKTLRMCAETGSALLLEDHGSLIYEDYAEKHNLSRTEMTAVLQAQLAAMRETTGLSASGGGNQYVLSTVDWLSDIPMESSDYLIFDYDVPFYQMVVHGSVPYASNLPGNLSTDFWKEKLRWLETGSVPYFLLTAQTDDRLKYTVYQEPFNLYYANWEDTVRAVYDEFSRLSGYCSGVMTEHEILEGDLRRITYENGCVVLINYSDTAATVDAQTVPARGYCVLNGEGAIVCQG